jgi:tRNA(His) 5'-end guanylyltransferase
MWTALGDLVTARERDSGMCVPGDRWMSLRLDGCGFSKAVKKLRRLGLLAPRGFSRRFAAAMQGCLRDLMAHTNACVGYTQSDELIVFVPPTSVVKGVRMPHSRNGRVHKLATLAAGLVTSSFVVQLALWCAEGSTEAPVEPSPPLAKGGCSVAGDGDDNDNNDDDHDEDEALGCDDDVYPRTPAVSIAEVLGNLASVLPHFDCRVGAYGSWAEARALLLWRAHDCSVNGVSDAVYHAHGAVPGGSKAAQRGNTGAKVKWLHDVAGLLPLPAHQAHGTLLVRRRRLVAGVNRDPRRVTSSEGGGGGADFLVERGVTEVVGGPVLLQFLAAGASLASDPTVAAAVSP